MPNTCPTYAQDMSWICPRYVQDIPKICPRYARDMPEICPRYVQDMPEKDAKKMGKMSWVTMSTIFTKVGAKCQWGKMSFRQDVP